MALTQIQTVNGVSYIDLKEIIGIFNKESRDSNHYIVLRCGERIYMYDYHIRDLKNKLTLL